MRQLKVLFLLVLLLSTSGCSQISRKDLQKVIDDTVLQTVSEECSDHTSNRKSLYSYYLPTYMGRRSATESSDVLLANGQEILMSLNVSTVISDRYYSSYGNFFNDKVNEKALLSNVYQVIDSKGDVVKFCVNVFDADGSYYLQVRFRYFDFLCKSDINSIPVLLQDIIRVGRSAEMNQDAVIEAYSNKEIITYVQEQKSLFAQNIPENGTLEQMLIDYYPIYQLEEDATVKDSEEFYRVRAKEEMIDEGN